MDYFEESLHLHRYLKGKIGIRNKMDVRTQEHLSLVYSPGVAAPCLEIQKNPESVWDYTMKSNSVAIVTDGSAVLGLGNLGAEASIPVMEGKAMLFRRFGRINAFPICLDTQNVDEIVETVRRIAPVFGGVNLEDIAAPRSFEVEERLQDLGIPVFHDDQHGTAIVVLGALINAAKLVGKRLEDLSVVINGAGAAGIAIAKLLRCVDHGADNSLCIPVKDMIICDSKGIVHKDRDNLNDAKKQALGFTNLNHKKGSLKDALVGADVFIGVSMGNLLTKEDVQTMAKDAIIFALANPTPEIMPEEAYKGGAAIVGTGRSDLPNQVNNVLGFPGIFRGALDARAKQITPNMKLAAAYAIAESISSPSKDMIIPPALDEIVAYKVAKAVKEAALKDMEQTQ
ncbi:MULTISPECIES: NADP-dependent malic enzyme [unclassified Aureispira]|uniref:NAD(P)-dependent malic enzyme n=1 Tax=unclassified Aureispira TaxID=2649989 RepID=UPI0006983FFE|nr:MULTISPECIES: NADP-dependent malic enzyme [unclassified Aureispira]WMX15390.1 NADP-dependent malic enzyme [Aureispira sp. CCB-E]